MWSPYPSLIFALRLVKKLTASSLYQIAKTAMGTGSNSATIFLFFCRDSNIRSGVGIGICFSPRFFFW
uniref:Putative secreted protein n=1 Tax=Anopheles marajoara TaxID=58244 RepID=A0A2M4CFC7_9DIPT